MSGINENMPQGGSIASTASFAAQAVSSPPESHLALDEKYQRLMEETAALRQSEARFRSLTAAAFEGICLSDQGRILDGNDQFMAMFGYERSEMIGREIVTLIAPEARELIAERLRNNREEPLEHRLMRKDGTLFVGEAQAKMLLWDGGMARVTAVRDITERKQVETALRESEERYRTLVEHAPECVAVAINERIVYINPAGTAMFGTKESSGPEYFIGRSVFDFVPQEYRETVRQRREAVLATGAAAAAWEFPLLRDDGTTVFVEARAIRCVYDGQPAILNLIRDITHRKRAEMEQAAASQREQQALEDYTRRLIASQEAERRRIAGELHDSLGQNLLLIKNRIAQALKSPSLTAAAQDHLQAAAQLASDAIAEVRHISHDLRPYQLDQIGLTRSLAAMIDKAAESTGIEFERHIEDIDDVFSSDAATNLYRVVQECINNVLKHAAARHVKIDIERDVRHVRLRITDDGQGFATAPGEGSGMGLRNVVERVRLMGGTLRLHTAPGEGAFVEVAIPVSEGALG